VYVRLTTATQQQTYWTVPCERRADKRQYITRVKQ